MTRTAPSRLLAAAAAWCAAAAFAAPPAGPAEADAHAPSGQTSFQIESSGSPINATLYLADGAGPHPAVLFLHGFPGRERNSDLAQALRSAGYQVLTLDYRGMWGSAGQFSFAHAVEDAASALAFLRTPAAVSSYNIDVHRIIVVGHSVGGYVALQCAARDRGVRAVAALAPLNATAPEFQAFLERRRRAHDVNFPGAPVVAASLDAMVEEPPGYDFHRELAALRDRPVFLAAGTHDGVLPIPRHLDPIVQALRDAGASRLEIAVIADDHMFSVHRIELAQRIVAWLQVANPPGI